MAEIRPWRVYNKPLPTGYRVLVDRLWPRGQRKADLDLDAWDKDLAPSTELRKWFAHDPERWDTFRTRYLQELQDHRNEARQLLATARSQPILLLYAAHDEAHNGALVLAEFLRSLASQ